jgi:hypothetical protein
LHASLTDSSVALLYTICCASLEEYLEKLVDVLHDDGCSQGNDSLLLSQQSDGGASFGGDGIGAGTRLDFAQAALLVQNSSAVYSRKVDYFDGLVKKALEGLQQQHASSQSGGEDGSAARGKRRNDASEKDRAFWELLRDENYDFLTLDDDYIVAKPSDITRGRRNHRRGVAGSGDSNNNSALLSSSRQSGSFYSHSTLSQLQRLSLQQPNGSSQHSSSSARLLQHLEATGTDPFGVDGGLPYRFPAYHTLNLVGSRCELTPTGALLLPGVAGAPPGSRLLARRRQRDASSPIPTVVQTSTPGAADEAAGSTVPGARSDSSVVPANGADDEFPNDFDDHDNDGPGFDFGESGEEDHADEPRAGAAGSSSEATGGGAVAGVLKTSRDRRAPGNGVEPRKAVKFDDPWELLDPHQPLGTHRPLKKGKTLVIPAGLHDLPSDCVTGARTKRRIGASSGAALKQASQLRPQTPPLSGSYASDTYRHLSQGTDLREIPLTRLAFGGEFSYIAKRHRQAKEAERRRARREAQGLPPARSEYDPFAINDPFDDNDDADFGAFDGDDGADRDVDEYDDDGGGAGWADDDNATGNAGLASVDDVFRGDGTRASRAIDRCYESCKPSDLLLFFPSSSTRKTTTA